MSQMLIFMTVRLLCRHKLRYETKKGVLLVHLSYLQPFEDVNKRVARLAANIPLVKHNLCPLSFIGLSKSPTSKEYWVFMS